MTARARTIREIAAAVLGSPRSRGRRKANGAGTHNFAKVVVGVLGEVSVHSLIGRGGPLPPTSDPAGRRAQLGRIIMHAFPKHDGGVSGILRKLPSLSIVRLLICRPVRLVWNAVPEGRAGQRDEVRAGSTARASVSNPPMIAMPARSYRRVRPSRTRQRTRCRF